MPLISEGIVTTQNEDGSVNIAPMGPIVDREMTQLSLRPFKSSHTYRNLKRHRTGIFHITDDVSMLASAAIGELNPPPPLRQHAASGGWIVEDACRWYAFDVLSIDDQAERTDLRCQITDRGRLRDFFGFNRAKHAVLEAAILATRVEFLPAETIAAQMQELEVTVGKTAGNQEQRAFELLREYIHRELSTTKS